MTWSVKRGWGWVMVLCNENGAMVAQNDKIELLDGVDQEAYFRERLKAFVQRLTALGSHVWLVKQVPEHPFEPPKYLTLLVMQEKDVEGYDFDGVNIPKDKENLYSLSYSQFVVPLVKAVQEQELKIEELNIELGKQKQINAEKDRLLSELLKRIEIIELKLK